MTEWGRIVAANIEQLMKHMVKKYSNLQKHMVKKG